MGRCACSLEHKNFALIFFLASAAFLGKSDFAGAQTRVTVGVTETIETHNPYGDSVSLLYGIWSEITGPFCTYNYTKGDFEGRLGREVESGEPDHLDFLL